MIDVLEEYEDFLIVNILGENNKRSFSLLSFIRSFLFFDGES